MTFAGIKREIWVAQSHEDTKMAWAPQALCIRSSAVLAVESGYAAQGPFFVPSWLGANHSASSKTAQG